MVARVTPPERPSEDATRPKQVLFIIDTSGSMAHEEKLDQARRDLGATAQMINARSAQPSRNAPRNSDACFRYGSACEYFDVCSGAGSLEDETQFVQLGHNERLQERNAA